MDVSRRSTAVIHVVIALLMCGAPFSAADAANAEEERANRPQLHNARLIPGEYPLRWNDAPPPVMLFGSGEALDLASEPPAGLTVPSAPPDAVRGYASLRLGAPERSHALVFEASPDRDDRFHTLYADVDGDGEITLAERFSAPDAATNAERPGTTDFSTVRFRCRYGNLTREVPVRISASYLMSFRAALAGCWQGEVDTDRGKMAVFLADESGRARYDRRYSEGTIEGNGHKIVFLFLDRTFTGQVHEHGAIRDQLQPLSDIQSFCGRLYRFTPSPMGDRLRIEPATESPGTLAVTWVSPSGGPLQVRSLFVTGRRGLYLVIGASSVQLPPDDYALCDVIARAKGTEVEWVFEGPARSPVRSGQTTSLRLDGRVALYVYESAPGAATEDFWPWRRDGIPRRPPQEPHTLALRRGKQCRLVAGMRNAEGYRLWRNSVDDRYEFRLTDGEGKTALKGQLPSEDGSPPLAPVIPEELAPGNYTLEVTVDTGPYQGRLTTRRPVVVR